MLDRKHAVIDDTELVEQKSRRTAELSDAEVATCTCPDLCIRDHEYE